MNVVKHLVVAVSLSLLGGAALAADPATKGGFEIGTLTCTSDPGTQENRIINSKVQVNCELKYNKGKQERYVGETGIGVGLDLNWNRSDTLVYTVIAGTQDTTPGAGALAGKFVGGKGSVSLGVGGGVGVLVGGSSTNLTLQPLALEGSKGFSLAGGVSYLTLKLAE